MGTLGVSFLGAEAVNPLGHAEGLRALAEGLLGALSGTLQGLFALLAPPSLLPPLEPTPLQAALKGAVGPQGALVFVLLYTPCVATLAALRQVVGPRWAALAVAYQLPPRLPGEPGPAMIQEVLALLATPKTASQLAQALGLRPETVALLLKKFAAQGYAQPLGCRGACSVCAF